VLVIHSINQSINRLFAQKHM